VTDTGVALVDQVERLGGAVAHDGVAELVDDQVGGMGRDELSA
jgi:hypothetical protein